MGVFMAGSAFAVVGDPAGTVDTYSAGDPANGIVSSRHNLGSFSMHISTLGTTELCVFCHTPHHTNTANNLKPMWNRGTSAPTSFTAYGTTIGGTTVASADIGSTSLACLSCHDGVTTFDNIVNAPGKGGVSATGSVRGWVFSDFGSPVPSNLVSSRLVIGLDLSNDHPMSIVYNGAVSATNYTGSRASLRASNTTISTIDLTSDTADSSVTYDGGNLAKNLWAVRGFIDGDATIADLLRGASNNTVECSSCHDPHFNNKSYNEVDSTYANSEFESNGLFLRRVGGNTGSGVCRTCHAK
ncbi:MAG: hypothetical protein Q7T24_00305 [Deltaproteobacteria bacterium]|nr:hypothetical protein [Deltaproteobacteria bacterium]